MCGDDAKAREISNGHEVRRKDLCDVCAESIAKNQNLVVTTVDDGTRGRVIRDTGGMKL
jgi:hypothetical protein